MTWNPRLILVISIGACLTGPATAWPAALILNEYNAVRSDEFLNGGTAEADQDGGQAVDPAFAPRAPGNGGDWFELVVVEDHLDLQRVAPRDPRGRGVCRDPGLYPGGSVGRPARGNHPHRGRAGRGGRQL